MATTRPTLGLLGADVADPLIPAQQATEDARERRPGRWSSTPSSAWTVDSWLGPFDYVCRSHSVCGVGHLVSWAP